MKSIKGALYRLLAALVAVAVLVFLFSVDAVWAQIVAGILIAAIAVPVILIVLVWMVAKSVEADCIVAIEREAQRRAEAALEVRKRRERSRQTYNPGVGFLGEK